MRSRVNSWRWPRLRREFFRRRFLNAMIFGPRALFEHFGRNRRAGDHRSAERYAVAADHQHLAELDDLARARP